VVSFYSASPVSLAALHSDTGPTSDRLLRGPRARVEDLAHCSGGFLEERKRVGVHVNLWSGAVGEVPVVVDSAHEGGSVPVDFGLTGRHRDEELSTGRFAGRLWC
jgi:hypothetical protein